jgi:hypothetical protein
MDVVGELPGVPEESDVAIDGNRTDLPGADPSPAVDEFRRSVLSTVDSRIALPAGTVRASGFASAQALRVRDDGLGVCRELFVCPVTSRRMSDDEGATFRDAVLGGTTMNLYRLNKVGGQADASPHHQVRLLALVSGDLDCVFPSAPRGGGRPPRRSGRERVVRCELAQLLRVPICRTPDPKHRTGVLRSRSITL